MVSGCRLVQLGLECWASCEQAVHLKQVDVAAAEEVVVVEVFVVAVCLSWADSLAMVEDDRLAAREDLWMRVVDDGLLVVDLRLLQTFWVSSWVCQRLAHRRAQQNRGSRPVLNWSAEVALACSSGDLEIPEVADEVRHEEMLWLAFLLDVLAE